MQKALVMVELLFGMLILAFREIIPIYASKMANFLDQKCLSWEMSTLFH